MLRSLDTAARGRSHDHLQEKAILQNLNNSRLAGSTSLNQVAAKYQLNPQMLSQWKSDFIKNASVAFERNKDEAGKLRKRDIVSYNKAAINELDVVLYITKKIALLEGY